MWTYRLILSTRKWRDRVTNVHVLNKLSGNKNGGVYEHHSVQENVVLRQRHGPYHPGRNLRKTKCQKKAAFLMYLRE